jgi:hypothetical protein
MIFYLDAEILLDLFLLILYPLKSEMVELAEDRYLELREKQLWQRNNKSQGIFKIYAEYVMMIIKFVVRTRIINKLK